MRLTHAYLTRFLTSKHSYHLSSVIFIFSWLWHIFWWIWTSVIVGGLVVGVVISYVTTGTSGLANPSAWAIVHLIFTYPLLATISLTGLGIATLLAYLAYKHEQKLLREATYLIANSSRDLIAVKEASICNMPYKHNAYFTGREELLTKVYDTLRTGIPAGSMLTLFGMGGVGKTQIAIEYVHRYRRDYQWIFWIRAHSQDTLISDFVSLAELLPLSVKDGTDQALTVEAVKGWLKLNSNWLLVLDSADDLSDVSNFIPPTSSGHILLTTRAQASGEYAQSLRVESMGIEESIIFLLHRAKIIPLKETLESVSVEDRIAAQEIVEKLEGLPLALDQAAAYIEETHCGLAGYLETYRDHRNLLLRRRGELASGHLEPIATTWTLALEKIERSHPAAAEIMRLCAFFAPVAIPEHIFLHCPTDFGPSLTSLKNNRHELNIALKELLKFSLIHRKHEMNKANVIVIHQLVQAVIKDDLKGETRLLWAERAVRLINDHFPEVEVQTWPQCERYLSHALGCVDFIDQKRIWTEEAANLLDRVGKYLYQRTRYKEAEPLLVRALEIREQKLGREHITTAVSLHNLGELYRAIDRYKQGEVYVLRALEIRQKELKPSHPDIGFTLHCLAWLYERQGKYEQAESRYIQALNIKGDELGFSHPDTVISRNHLAWVDRLRGEHDKAEELYQFNLEITKQLPILQSEHRASSFQGLALVYLAQNKNAEAETCLEEALNIRKAVLGLENHATTSSLNDLALACYKQGKYDQAQQHILLALKMNRRILGPKHRGTATSLYHLGILRELQGKYNKAVYHYERALKIREKILGPDHPQTSLVKNRYDELLQKKRSIHQG